MKTGLKMLLVVLAGGFLVAFIGIVALAVVVATGGYEFGNDFSWVAPGTGEVQGIPSRNLDW